ncbi:type II secretion system F family protein [uncultured Desulfuromonas sp.]|uniref:type II secretion system F family protein n=1 Tax=uncultured Desulfuromonas sp. TaxID=181013 RepID=UPI002AAA8DFD|nr:type II secretion system F family protein [uncultured Desulfuromonas sp.]
MPLYRYSAMNERGEIQRSTLVAADPSAAAASLAGRGLSLLQLQETDDEATDFSASLARMGRVRQREVIIFLRMLGALIGSGITITEAISVLQAQSSGRRLRAVLEDIKTHIEGGISLSEALAQYPRLFPEIAVNMVRAGESGGILQETLNSLVVYLEKKAALRRTVIRAFIYPSIVLLVAIGVIIFLVTFVIPRFLSLLEGRPLPWNTQLLFDLSQFLIRYHTPIIVAVLGTVALTVVLFSMPTSRQVIDRYKILIPVLGPVFRFAVIVQFTRTLASLLQSGLPLVESLRLTNATLSNQALQTALDDGLNKVVGGEPFSETIRAMPIFTSLAAALFRVGEQSGSMDDSAKLLADIYEAQLEDRVALMSSMIEPGLIISLGGIVGFVAWSLVAGMLSMYS